MNGKKDGKRSLVTRKSLFDHINQIVAVQNPNYWEEISDEDKKSFSAYMVHRFLSMKLDWIEVVNELQKYSNLKSKEIYKLYTNILPKGKQWLKYIKRRTKMEYPEWLINVIRNHLEYSRSEAIEAIGLYMLTEGGMLELREILEKWGIEEKKIKDLGIDVLGSIGLGDY